jgi:UDP-N-acetylglucosamine 2-epimerase (non-hydrolysing)
MKVATILGTRPEIIRLSRIIPALDKAFDHILIHTGQNYDRELSTVFFEELELRYADHHLGIRGDTPAQAISSAISLSDDYLRRIKPDAVLILGDTNSSMSAIAAKRLKIPIFHMEAGNRAYDERVPEEINRKIIDHISDINLPYSHIARENLLREGLPPDRIIVTGSPMNEVLHYHSKKIEASNILQELGLSETYSTVNGLGIIHKPSYFVVSAHREENINDSDRFHQLLYVLRQLAEIYKLPIIVSVHPRTRKVMESESVVLPPLVRLMRPLGFLDYIHLQMHAKAVLSDSGTITEESNIIGFPAINLRDTFERQESMEEAAVMLCGLNWQRIQEALTILPTHKRSQVVTDYNVPQVSEKIVRIILSYTDIINRTVWHR